MPVTGNDFGMGYDNAVTDMPVAMRDPLNVSISNNPDRTAAAITRAQWQHFLDIYRPVEEEALAKAMQTDFTREGDEAGQLARTAVQRSTGMLERNLRRSGATLSSEERSALRRRQNLSVSRAAAQAENTTRRGMSESRQRLLQGLVGIGRGVAQTASGGINAAADMAAGRQAEYMAQKAQARNTNLSAAASIASLIIAM